MSHCVVMQMQTVQFYLKTSLKEHWGFDDPAGKDWSEFQRVEMRLKQRSKHLLIECNLTQNLKLTIIYTFQQI